MYSAEVRRALEDGGPVVALESTILSHGMPHPQNVVTARAVEERVRAGGAVPATIAVLDGNIRIGLNDEQLQRVGSGGNLLKLSSADLAFAVAVGASGSTTVAATMICARIAGIRVFATGGIGGVHRGAEQTMDISADIEELARTDVAVVCAGAKALLDLPKTLEALETRGVPVVGFGTAEFPAFWSSRSGLMLSLHVADAAQAAAYLRTKASLGMQGGVLIVAPVPPGEELPRAQMEVTIEQAVHEAHEQNIAGKAVTPWLLDRIYRLTGGASLTANIALIKNNASIAAAIASAL
ncbi:MAG: pseudouridine-5'-phosphate glycosidase [Candidatus Baltobacteraceae bacterium]